MCFFNVLDHMYSKQIILVYLWLHYALTSNESLGCSSDWCLNKSRSRGWGNPKLFPLNCCNKTGTHGYRQFPHQNIWYRSSRKEHGNWNCRFQWSSRGKPFNYNQLYKQIHGKEVPRDSWVFWYPNIYARSYSKWPSLGVSLGPIFDPHFTVRISTPSS